MKKKATLTIDPVLLKKGKSIAHLRHISLSQLVEDYLESIPYSSESISEKWEKMFSPVDILKTRETQDFRLKAILDKHARN